MKTVSLNQIAPGTTFLVRGKLAYARLTSQVAGEELEKDKARRLAKGWNPIDKPYTTATINDAHVEYIDPNHKRIEEIYAEESMYQSKSQTAQGLSFTAYNKGKQLPYISVEENNVATQIQPEGELASGLDVSLVMKVFAAKPNHGLGLEGVIIHEPVRYYSNIGAGLASHGLTFKPLSPEERAKSAQPSVAPTAPVANQPQAYPVPAETAAPFPPAPAAPAYPTPPVNPYATTPVPQTQPEIQPQPAPQTAYQAPYAAPTAPAQPVQPTQPAQTGIRYDPTADPNRNNY